MRHPAVSRLGASLLQPRRQPETARRRVARLASCAAFGAVMTAGVAGMVLSAEPAAAQEHAHRQVVIVSPADQAVVSNPVSVAFDFAPSGGGEGGGFPHWGEGEHHHGSPHAFLVIDAPLPDAGATVPADSQHVPFPEGQKQTTVTLTPGRHQLQIVLVDREGAVSRHFHPGTPITVSVR